MRPIDADKLKEGVLKWLPSDPCGIEEKEIPFETDICVSMLMEIEEAPTIEPKKGEWKHLKGDEWLCSNCGYVVWTEGSWEHPLERGKDYCEHCGAQMRGADDE